MKNKLILALAAILVAAIGYVVFFRASDEDRIRQKLGALEAAVKSGASEPNLAVRSLRIQQSFARIFAPRVRTDIPQLEAGDTPREELVALVASGEERLPGLDVAFSRVHLEVDGRAKPPRADVDALATLTGTDRGDLTKMRSVYQVTLHFEKSEGEWRINRIAAAPVD